MGDGTHTIAIWPVPSRTHILAELLHNSPTWDHAICGWSPLKYTLWHRDVRFLWLRLAAWLWPGIFMGILHEKTPRNPASAKMLISWSDFSQRSTPVGNGLWPTKFGMTAMGQWLVRYDLPKCSGHIQQPQRELGWPNQLNFSEKRHNWFRVFCLKDLLLGSTGPAYLSGFVALAAIRLAVTISIKGPTIHLRLNFKTVLVLSLETHETIVVPMGACLFNLRQHQPGFQMMPQKNYPKQNHKWFNDSSGGSPCPVAAWRLRVCTSAGSCWFVLSHSWSMKRSSRQITAVQ